MSSLVRPAYQWHLGNARRGPVAPHAAQSSQRSAASRLVSALKAWSQRMARERADARYLAAAMDDPRLMADLRRALDEGDPALAVPARAAMARYRRAEMRTV